MLIFKCFSSQVHHDIIALSLIAARLSVILLTLRQLAAAIVRLNLDAEREQFKQC